MKNKDKNLGSSSDEFVTALNFINPPPHTHTPTRPPLLFSQYHASYLYKCVFFHHSRVTENTENGH